MSKNPAHPVRPLNVVHDAGRAGLGALREKLAAQRGPQFWRSLDELAGSPAFEEVLRQEFPRWAPAEWDDGPSRRRFLQLAGASLALAGLSACTRQPEERLVPYVRQPEDLVPGRPRHYATAMPLLGYATGLLVESHTGRPTKIEGNPSHPASLGASDSFHQASILGLYDPDRSQTLSRLGRIVGWERFVADVEQALVAQESSSGAGLRLLTGTVTSPSLAAALAKLQERFPRAVLHQYEPLGRDAQRTAAKRSMGGYYETYYDLERADAVVCLDSDLLSHGPAHLRYARQFATRRRAAQGGARPNRLWVVESTPTPTGSLADHRLALAPREIRSLALALAAELGIGGQGAGDALPPRVRPWLAPLLEDLRGRRGRSVVVAGEQSPPELHLLALAINDALGNRGSTVLHCSSVESQPTDQLSSLQELRDDMDAGAVDALFILGRNPVYEAPADLGLRQALEKVDLRVHLGLYNDETAQYCHWHLPQTHFLESWSDAPAFDGTMSLQQPLIQPLYEGRSPADLVGLLNGQRLSDYDLLRRHWQQRIGEGEFEATWRRSLHDGLVAGTRLPTLTPAIDREAVDEAVAGMAAAAAEGSITLLLRPDPMVGDGTFANNGWLQETPKPMTLLTWDNAALVSPELARRMGLETEDVVTLAAAESSLTAPIYVLPGQADDTVTLHLGYGRTHAGRVGSDAGCNGYTLRRGDGFERQEVAIEPTGGVYPLATTQLHHNIPLEGPEAERRDLVRHGTLARFKEDPQLFAHGDHHGEPASMFPPWSYEGQAWGMSIDLSSCLGCNACMVACQAENNIPVVGKEQVIAGREMHWIRIDRYFQGDLEAPQIHHQPVLCMHCEEAPCEIVCPVEATMHSNEGLNVMVYNRCVGTRYCSNNCPYKVRRFNFLHYAATDSPVLELARNPDVTVRSRGVMEKCSYCIQRISGARIAAKKDGRPVRDGELRTACQQACPSEAIVFGDINDAESAVAARKASSLDYSLLEELGTKPRTTYLAKLSNPHPSLTPPETTAHDEDEH